MTTLSILTDKEQEEFDYPPILSVEEKTLCFSLPKEVEKQIKHLRTPTNKVGFLLQYIYFKACKRFFLISRFREEDILYAANFLNIEKSKINLANYKKKIPIDHQSSILKLLDYRPFNNQTINWLKSELELRFQRLTEPRQTFLELLQLLYNHRVEVPTYHRLAGLISQYYLAYENQLLSKIEHNLGATDREN